MTIQTIDELLDFIETNYEQLSKEKYIELLKLTLQVYVSEKPSSKEIAIRLFNHIMSTWRLFLQDTNYRFLWRIGYKSGYKKIS